MIAVQSAPAAVPPDAADPVGPDRESPLRTTLARTDIERAVRLAIDNVLLEGLDDVFPRPFEVDDLAADARLRHAVFELAVERVACMRFDEKRFEPVETIAFPKRTVRDYRRCALLDPMDSIVYLTLALLAAPAIEQARPPTARGVALSYRLRPSEGRIYDSVLNGAYFVRETTERLARSDTKILATLDIQRFYDRVDHTWLGACLTRFGVDRALTRYLLALLDFWGERHGHGLPVGSNASRILAEAVLTPVDWTLIDAGVEFTRFVDDYRLFAPNAATAEAWLHRLADELAAQGLYSNLAKTGLYRS